MKDHCAECDAVHQPGPEYTAERSDGETVTNRICRACHGNWPCWFVRRAAAGSFK